MNNLIEQLRIHPGSDEKNIKTRLKASDEIERLTAEVSGLRDALTIYADRQGWTSFVPDSYRGECWEFDWNGDLGDKPWEMAVNGLNASDEKGQNP